MTEFLLGAPFLNLHRGDNGRSMLVSSSDGFRNRYLQKVCHVKNEYDRSTDGDVVNSCREPIRIVGNCCIKLHFGAGPTCPFDEPFAEGHLVVFQTDQNR